jgi:toxin-antitoxin system PIN domain toxin
MNTAARVGLPWASLLAFLRLITSPRVFQRPLSMADAWTQVDAWLGSGPAWVPAPTQRHTEILARLLAAPGVHGNLVPDAHLAALAIEHGLELNSTDGDFARFAGLRWCNPLVPQRDGD